MNAAVSFFVPTPEQVAIERWFNAPGYPNVKVIARAGSGKTATARYLTHSTSRRGVYLAFGAKNAAEAREKFPAHMLVKTTHALAYAAMDVRSRWGHKLKNDGNKWPLWRVIREFGIHEEDGISAEHCAYAAMQGLRCFLYSADPELTLAHVRDRSKDDDYFAERILDDYHRQHPMATQKARELWAETVLPNRVKALRQYYNQRLLGIAKDLWEAQISTTHPYPIEHDTYLKLWQLSQPIIPGIEYLILDEVQDSNACVLDIVLRQSCQIIFIGDPAQGIFGFRKAINGLELLDAKTLYLSLSFRFGQPIADVANAILRIAYPDLVPIQGNPQVYSTLGPIQSGRYALVARTNAGLFDEAVELARNGQRFHVVGSLKDPIERARSVYHLWAGNDPRKIRHPDIKPYDDWETLKNESQYDADLARYVRLITDKEDGVLELCDLLEQAGEVRANQADVVLTTVHKCVHPDTWVETPNGIAAIKNIPDHGIIGTPSGPRPYADKFIREISDTLILTTKKGYSIEVTPDHGMTVLNQQGFLRIEAVNLKEGDLLCLRVGAIIDSEKLPSLHFTEPSLDVRAVRFNLPTQMSNELAEFLGLMVADGTVFKKGFRVTKRHSDVLERFCQLAINLFNCKIFNGNILGTPCCTVHSSQIAQWLLMIDGLSPHAKGVPNCILESPLIAQAKFLRGLFEDGTVNIKQDHIDHIHFETKYQKIAKTVQIMLLRFGIIATCKQRVSNEFSIFSLYIYGDNILVFREKIGFISQFKNERLAQAKPVVRCNDSILASDDEINSLWNLVSIYDFRNAKLRKTISRYKAKQYLAKNPGNPKLDWLAYKLLWHYDKIVSVEKSRSKTYCVSVPEGSRFLQNGFDGWNSKGLEYPQVRMADDFSRLKIDEQGQLSGPLEEIHIAYVASTRAQLRLEPNAPVQAAVQSIVA